MLAGSIYRCAVEQCVLRFESNHEVNTFQCKNSGVPEFLVIDCYVLIDISLTRAKQESASNDC